MEKRLLLFLCSIFCSFFLVHYWFAPPPSPSVVAAASPDSVTKAHNQISPVLEQEDFYVLENDVQQLVFSTRGGALAEINLRFGTVKELELDRELKRNDPINAQFPLHSAKRWDASQERAVGGYYPLLRRPLFAHDGSLQYAIHPRVYALNLVSDREEISAYTYRVTRFEKNLIQFEGEVGGRTIKKTFLLPEGSSFCFELHLDVQGEATGLWLTSGVPEVELVSGSFVPSLRYQVSRGKSQDVEDIELSDKKPLMIVPSLAPDWISNSNGFLGVILTPLNELRLGFRAQQIPAIQAPTRLGLLDPQTLDKYPGFETFLPVTSGEQAVRIFAGPFDHTLLQQVDTGTSSNYENAKSQQGWFSFISQPFSQFLTFLLEIFYQLTHSWGFSIILLTIALRLMMYPLNSWSIRSTMKMQELAPKVKAIQERYKKDPKRGQLEVMNLYRESGANPLSGCLPMLLQMPFLIGMFYVLKSCFPLRGASFVPGWIDNLAAPDVLFRWTTPIWFIGNEFHLLPILTGFSMYLQQRLTSKTPKDPREMSDMQKQQKMMGMIFPVFLTLLFYGFPSGLNIYFLFSTLLGILQQWFVTRKMQKVTHVMHK
jgi:YidC/Oxa1 family membrane protein insertase